MSRSRPFSDGPSWRGAAHPFEDVVVAKVPPFLGEIGDDDARWLHEHGTRRPVRSGERIITEGKQPDHVFVVLEGEFLVSSVSLKEPELQRVRSGEVLGEMSYINRQPPGASVDAVTDGLLLAVPRARIDAKIQEDPAFGSRFMKVLSEFALSRFWRFGRRALPDANPPLPESVRVDEMIKRLLDGDF